MTVATHKSISTQSLIDKYYFSMSHKVNVKIKPSKIIFCKINATEFTESGIKRYLKAPPLRPEKSSVHKS